jgi:hypothetical protein
VTETTSEPEAGEYVTFVSHLEHGFGIPFSLFFRCFCAFYRIKPSDLGPHSIQQIDVFVAFRESYLGCEPYFPLWLTLFPRHHSGKGESKLVSGGIVFLLQQASNFFALGLPKKATAD